MNNPITNVKFQKSTFKDIENNSVKIGLFLILIILIASIGF